MASDKPYPSLETLAHASPPALRVMYEALFKRSPPKWSRADYLRGNLAWAIQTLEQGHSPRTLRQSLLNTANKGTPTSSTKTYQPGTRLIREWQGQTYEVTILDNGYLWQGETYRSLSKIAEAITGTRRSGPRFFGLKNDVQQSQRER